MDHIFPLSCPFFRGSGVQICGNVGSLVIFFLKFLMYSLPSTGMG